MPKHISPSAHATHASYITGFVISLILTLTAFGLVYNHLLHGNAVIAAIVSLAIIQLFVQLVFFLHLGRESSPRWNLVFFMGAVTVVIILVFGSLWIMNHLTYHMSSPSQTDQSILKDEGVKP
jgi:cytochrome o ubiquinol oxidase operon protein cyoD